MSRKYDRGVHTAAPYWCGDLKIYQRSWPFLTRDDCETADKAIIIDYHESNLHTTAPWWCGEISLCVDVERTGMLVIIRYRWRTHYCPLLVWRRSLFTHTQDGVFFFSCSLFAVTF